MRVLFVPVKGNTWFWHLSAESLDQVRHQLVIRYPGAERLLFDGIRGVLCDEGPLLSIDADRSDEMKLGALDSAAGVAEAFPRFPTINGVYITDLDNEIKDYAHLSGITCRSDA